MYKFPPTHRSALERLAPLHRLVVERWVELTYEDTHPYWRAYPMTIELSAPCAKLVDALASGNEGRVAAQVSHVSGALLGNGFNRDWQYNAVKRYLLDPEAKFSDEPFLDRVARLGTGQSSVSAEAAAGEICVEWPITEFLPANARLPWRDPVLHLGADALKYQIIERGKGRGRQWVVSTTIDHDLSRSIHRAAAALKSDAAALLDIFRIMYGESHLFVSHQITVRNSAKMSYVRPKPFPRVRSRVRARKTTLRVFKVLQNRPASSHARALTGACHWLSMALNQWDDNPRFATGLLWMALEALFGPCVIEHQRKCRHTHELTAVEMYVQNLREQLAAELDDYIARLRGSASTWKKSAPWPPFWCRNSALRNDRPIEMWLADVLSKISEDGEDEPLFRCHANELLNFNSDVVAGARARTENQLRRLKRMRNAVAHEGDPLLAEEETDFLAALGAELLFMVFETMPVASHESLRPPNS